MNRSFGVLNPPARISQGQSSPPSVGIAGSLDGVSVSDVLQFIHLGERTGTLVLRSGNENGPEARIGFQNGKLYGAQGPDAAKLGDLLVEDGLVSQERVLAAVEIQAAESPRRLLGQVLVGQGHLDPAGLHRLVVRRIEATISQVALWDEGSFEFVFNDLAPTDDIALDPFEVVPESEINTQKILLEATRIFDERNREDLGEATAAVLFSAPQADRETRRWADPDLDLDETLPVAGEGAIPEPSRGLEDTLSVEVAHETRALWLEVVSFDLGLARRLAEGLPPGSAYAGPGALAEIGLGSPPEALSVVVLDLRQEFVSLGEVRALRRRQPKVAVIAIIDRAAPLVEVYGAGALAAVPGEPEAIVACIRNLLDHRERSPVEALETVPSVERAAATVARLRQVYGDLRSGRLSATVALNLMHLISDSVERAVLFLHKGDSLVAVGAFGTGGSLRPLAEATGGYAIPLTQNNALTGSFEDGETRLATFDQTALPEDFMRLVGRPGNGQAVIFPVVGVRRAIAVIYSDNGHRDEKIEDIEILEMATAQVGMAFENELLRRGLPAKA